VHLAGARQRRGLLDGHVGLGRGRGLNLGLSLRLRPGLRTRLGFVWATSADAACRRWPDTVAQRLPTASSPAAGEKLRAVPKAGSSVFGPRCSCWKGR
jgi:hypothetical protein